MIGVSAALTIVFLNSSYSSNFGFKLPSFSFPFLSSFSEYAVLIKVGIAAKASLEVGQS